jgi:hypothetical protein
MMADMPLARDTIFFLPFPPLKKGGRGDLLFMRDKSKSPLIPLLQRGRTLSCGALP